MSPGVRRIAILGHTGRPGARRAAMWLRAALRRRRMDVRLEATFAASIGLEGEPLARLARWCQILVTLGGDGTALTGARALAGRRGTLLPVNLGGLGFLTVSDGGGLAAAVRRALAGRLEVTRRRVLSAVVRRNGRVVHRGVAMNDGVVKGKGGLAAVHLRLAAFGADLGYLVADGLIAATPAGSTAYSLSAGGPVLDPQLEALVVTPACPHALDTRPMVLGAGAELAISVLGSIDHVVLLLDGQEVFALERHDDVRLRLDRRVVRVFRDPASPFARTLQSKLGWQGSSKRSL